MKRDIMETARGRWLDILAGLGIDKVFLRNRHGPCPICKGVDRYRFDDKAGAGTYYCNQCGAGNGVTLLRKFHGWTFREACQKIEAFLGQNFHIDAHAPSPPPPPPVRTDRDKRRKAIERVLFEATAFDIVEEYLARRGMLEWPEVLRGHRGLALYDTEDHHLVGRFPAVVAPIVSIADELQSAHRIYLSEPRVKKLMPPVDGIKGCAVRLFEATHALGIAEGIETAIAAYEIFRIPTWSVISTAGIETFEPPPALTSLTVFADNDRNFAGQKAAFALGARLANQYKGIEVHVEVPPKPDTDWNDVLLDRRPLPRPEAPQMEEAF